LRLCHTGDNGLTAILAELAHPATAAFARRSNRSAWQDFRQNAKLCRLRPLREGAETVGHLWKLGEKFRIDEKEMDEAENGVYDTNN
jgi:hypothetical protein